MTPCPVCGSQQRPYFKQLILGKHEVAYFFCDACGLLRTEQPHWLADAYSDAIAVTDTGLVARNLAAAARTAALFGWLFGGKGRYIDLAGGYGLLTRLMRDIGFDYYWADRYAQNLLARGFEAETGTAQAYRGATAFEVLEHLEQPVEFIADAFSSTRCDALFFSTELYPGAQPPPSWWYYSLSTGQHIAFFHRRTLQKIADVLGLCLNSHGSFHMLSRMPVSALMFRLLTARLSVKLFSLFVGKLFRSKTETDHLSLAGAVSTQPNDKLL
jgi:hypothetical protein